MFIIHKYAIYSKDSQGYSCCVSVNFGKSSWLMIKPVKRKLMPPGVWPLTLPGLVHQWHSSEDPIKFTDSFCAQRLLSRFANLALCCASILSRRLLINIREKKTQPDTQSVTLPGQTVNHMHIHLILRYAGDVDEPEGSVRGVISQKRAHKHSCLHTQLLLAKDCFFEVNISKDKLQIFKNTMTIAVWTRPKTGKSTIAPIIPPSQPPIRSTLYNKPAVPLRSFDVFKYSLLASGNSAPTSIPEQKDKTRNTNLRT